MKKTRCVVHGRVLTVTGTLAMLVESHYLRLQEDFPKALNMRRASANIRRL